MDQQTLFNTLFYGDNIDILKAYIKDETIDLIYLDPPFKSNQNYNILFTEKDGSKSNSQIKAFGDTWHWNQEAALSFENLVEEGGAVSRFMQSIRILVGENDMLAYLSMMAPRLLELHRVLKPTGSIYLHCDPTASHYLKLLMDSVFGPENFRNEIIWRRTGSHNKVKRFGPIHDTIFYYTKTKSYTWNNPKKPYMRKYVEENFIKDQYGLKSTYYGNVLTGSGIRNGESGNAWRGVNPTEKGRHWAIPRALLSDLEEEISHLSQHEKLDYLFNKEYIKFNDGNYWPVYERYLKPTDGQSISDIWAFQPYTSETVYNSNLGIDEDVRWLSTKARERLGYPTQKPEGLLERIIKASSNEGDWVLDPFCGCGTSIAASQKLKRNWIGIDITHLAIALIRHRLQKIDNYNDIYKVIGEPKSLPDAEALAIDDRYQFQWWALGLVGAKPTSDKRKKGSDKGIDGQIYFHDEIKKTKTKQIIISVKSGKTDVTHIRDLHGVIEREKAQIGVLVTLKKPTKPMELEAISAGFYESPFGKHPRIQILTIEEILMGRIIDYPRVKQLSFD